MDKKVDKKVDEVDRDFALIRSRELDKVDGEVGKKADKVDKKVDKVDRDFG